MDETNRRREKQILYNQIHHITPTTIKKSIAEILDQGAVLQVKTYDSDNQYAIKDQGVSIAAEEGVEAYSNPKELEKEIATVKKEMEKAAKNLDFIEAARLRDKMMMLKEKLKK